MNKLQDISQKVQEGIATVIAGHLSDLAAHHIGRTVGLQKDTIYAIIVITPIHYLCYHYYYTDPLFML